jgi:amino acid adenylation domain-containing protein
MSSTNIEDIYFLSPLQEGLLFHAVYTPESGVYFQQLKFRFDGTLDAEAWRRAWLEVVARHPVFRTAFVWEGRDRPLQVVLKKVKIPWQELDWRGIPEEEQHARLEAFLDEDRRRGFDLARAPLLRMTHIRLSDDANEFVCSHHHLLLDGWSTSNVLKEVFAFYRPAGAAPPNGLPRPYKEYIGWLQRQDMAKAERFWREHLRGFTAPTPLPAGSGGPSPLKGGGRQEKFQTFLDEETTERLRSLARRREVTLSTLVTGAWALLLGRYSGERDVVFGVTVSGRPAALDGVEAMVGLFINTLPVRVPLPPDAPLAVWLPELQSRLLDLREYEYSPLVQVHGWSEVPRGVSLFESVVIFENYPVDLTRRSLNDRLGVSDIRSIERNSFPLGLVAAPGPRLFLQVIYDAERFDEPAAARMMGHLRALFESMAADAGRPLSQLPILTGDERRRLSEWNDTAAPYERSARVHELFEAQVARTPDAVAAVGRGRRLTYGELNERANRLAHHLRAAGVTSEVRVGLCVERSPEMLVGLLGILKAGGAYVPLDARNPRERLSLILEGVAAPVLVTQAALAENLPARGARVVRLDADRALIAREPATNPVAPGDARCLAYVLHTSGSTGRPKGVMVSHASVINFLRSMCRRPGLTAADVMLSVTTLSFDIAALELLGPLVVGGRVVIADEDTVFDGPRLARQIVSSGATVMQGTPATWRLLLDAGWQNETGLRVFCGGEALPQRLAAELLEKTGTLWNLYGPTETTIWSAVHQVESADSPVPIGRPIANTQLYVLDEHFQLLPPGGVGELYIGGDGLARGYLDRPGLTAEKFLPDPFGGQPGARLYRTGDFARYLPDGSLEYLGRGDNQVKIRGFRIELGEVEAALAAHEKVRECVAVVREDAHGDKRLVAYVVAGAGFSPRALCRFLESRLPSYMIPADIFRLDSLPLAHNGKVDRRRLPVPARDEGVAGDDFAAPRGQIEELLLQMWAQVLGGRRVGVNDNFFALGGHSLNAGRVVSRVREAFQVELPLRAFFERPTVAGLAEAVEAAMREEQGSRLPPIVAAARGRQTSMSFAQQRLWFIERLVPGNAFYNLAAALRFEGPLRRGALEHALGEVVKRHEILRTTFDEADGQLIQIVGPGGAVPLSAVDLCALPGAEREAAAQRFASAEARRPFDLVAGPLLRASLLRLGVEEHLLLLNVHHIIFDGWSLGVLLGELTALYRTHVTGEAARLPELPVQYADYALWQQHLMQGDVLEAGMGYWRRRLAGAPAVLELPADRPRPPARSYRGATHDFALPERLTRPLREFCRQEAVTMFMLTLAVFKTLLYRYTGQADILVGAPVAGRNRDEVERLIGFFVNTVVLRTDLSGEPTFRELVGRVRETSLGAYAHQDVPFEKLVEELHPPRDMSHTPLFQVMFDLQNTPTSALNFPQLKVSPVGVKGESAKFDLTLYLQEASGALLGRIEYSTDLFDAETIERMSGHFLTLAEAAVRDPDRRINEMSMLAEAERKRLLVGWNDTRADYPAGSCLHELFETQAARTPAAVAVSFEGGRLTYGELNESADRLARRLRRLGVGAESIVGVLLERSADLVVSLLAVLKAGGAYLPLDPEYPAERLAFMLADSEARVLLTQAGLSGRIEAAGVEVLLVGAAAAGGLNDEEEGGRGSGGGGGWRAARPDNLAYVIYTSGSTGRPKGTLTSHRAIANRLRWMQDRYRLTAADCVLQKTPFSFDVSVWEFFWPLMTGARLAVARPGGHRETAYLREVIEAERVTTLHFVPSMLALFLEEPGVSRCASVRQVMCSGEALSPELVNRFYETLPGRLHNLYGPTEAAVDVSSWECEPDARVVPVGRPIANVRLYILDARLQPVPVGVAGDLYIGGVAPARGYLRHPGLTAESFVPDPYAPEAGSRMYRTGDLARYLPDGNIDYLGRIDQQVKLRGFRIEPGEIESALREHEAVRDCVVAASEGAGGRHLVAYCVAQGSGAREGELRQFLQERVPSYMVPSFFVFLDEMPLSPNGKVDRRALPEADAARRERPQVYVAPRDRVESQLCGVWERLLGVSTVGITDNFFNLGGHSLLALSLIAEVQKRFGRMLPLATLFEEGTVEHLARVVREQRTPASASPLVAIQPGGSRQPVFFVHVGSGNVLCYLDLARHLGDDQPFYGLQDPSLSGAAPPFGSIEEMASAYVRHLRALQTAGPYVLGGWSFGGLVAFEMACQLTAAGQEVALLAVLDSVTPEIERGLDRPRDDATLLAILAAEMYLPVSPSDLRPLDPEERLRVVAEQMSRAGLVFDDPCGYLRRHLAIFESRVRATLAYRPGPYAGRVSLFVASTPSEGEGFHRGGGPGRLDLTQSWAKLAAGGLDVLQVPGTHHEIAREPNVQVLAELLRNCIAGALETDPLARR